VDIDFLNEVLNFVGIDYRATGKIPLPSGQRQVFIAESVEGDGRFVIKVSLSNPIATARLQREIRILNSLNSIYFPQILHNSFVTSSNLTDYYDNIPTATERERIKKTIDEGIKPFFITIESFVPHTPWQDCIMSLKPESNIVDFMIHIFTGMSELWNVKIVHRDLKPENILITSDLTPVIIDLGIAKSFNQGTVDLTQAFYKTPCTPRFASPEQLNNKKEDISYKSDQFSIGVIAFLILTGEYPYGDFEAIGAESLLANFNNNNISSIRQYNDNVSDDLISVIEKLLHVKPYKRFRDPKSILKKLNDIKEGIV
jgi:serine/threonine protein kinase